MYFEITTGWSRLTLGVGSGGFVSPWDLFAAKDGEAAPGCGGTVDGRIMNLTIMQLVYRCNPPNWVG